MNIAFVLQSGCDRRGRLEDTYSRRAQSTVVTFSWKDVAAVEAESLEEAIVVAQEAISGWVKSFKYYSKYDWRLEGRGKFAGIYHELEKEDD